MGIVVSLYSNAPDLIILLVKRERSQRNSLNNDLNGDFVFSNISSTFAFKAIKNLKYFPQATQIKPFSIF